MPNHTEFGSAASMIEQYRQRALEARRQLADVLADCGVRGGEAERKVLEAVAAQLAHADRLCAELSTTVAELRHRELLCRRYEARLQQWRDATDSWQLRVDEFHHLASLGICAQHPGHPPEAPRPPFPEAEHR